MSFSERAVRGFFWNHLGKLADIGLAYVVTIVIARMMGKLEYGVYVTVMSVASVTLILGSGGMDEALNKFVSQLLATKEDTGLRYLVRRLFTARFFLLAFLGCLVFALRGEFGVIFKNEELPRYFLLLALFILVQSLVNFFVNVFVAQAKTRLVFFVGTAARVLNLMIVWWLLHHDGDLSSVLVTFITVGVGSLLIFAGLCLPLLRGDSSAIDLRPVRDFSAVMLLNSFLALVLGRYSSVLLISHFWGTSDLTGYYDIAFSLTIMIEYAFALGFAGFGLSLAAELAAREPAKLGSARGLVIKYYQLFVIPTAVFCIWYAGDLVRMLYSDQYLAVVPLFRAFLCLQCLSVTLIARDFNATILFSLGKERLVLMTRAVVGLLAFSTSWFVIPAYGALGAIIVTGLSYLATTAVEYLLASRFLIFRYDWVFVAKIAVATAIALICVSYVSVHSTQVFLLVGGAYLLVVAAGYRVLRVVDVDIQQLLTRSGIFRFRRT